LGEGRRAGGAALELAIEAREPLELGRLEELLDGLPLGLRLERLGVRLHLVRVRVRVRLRVSSPSAFICVGRLSHK
jgi:hypothetical protein